MTAKSRTGFEILVCALLIGIAGDSLLRSVPWGLNVPVMAAVCAGALVVLKYRATGAHFSPRNLLLLGASLFFSSWFAIRDSEPLLFLNFLAVLLIGVMIFLPVIKLQASGSGVIHYVISSLAMGVSAAFLPALLLTKDLRWEDLAKNGRSRKALLVLRGAMIATPLLLIFGALFAAADAAFEGFLANTLDVVPQDLALHAFFTAFFAWPAAGFLRAMTLGMLIDGDAKNETEAEESAPRDFSEVEGESVTDAAVTETEDPPPFGERHIPSITLPDEDEKKAETEGDCTEKQESEPQTQREWSWKDFNNSVLPDFLTVGSVEVGVVLGSLNLLFLTFVVIQLPYLFGGFELVQTQPGLKLAEYARRGFGELFAASMLVLPVLMVLHWLIRRESERAVNLFRYLAAMQIGLLFVIMMSAFQRMIILTGELGYGMTTERFYPMAFMIWLAVVFLLFGYTVLRGERGKFAWNASLSALAMVAILNFVNPEDYVVRTNVNLMRAGRSFDAGYNSRLTADAVPALVEALPGLSEGARDTVLRNIVAKHCWRSGVDDLRVWNYSRQVAGQQPVISNLIRTRGCSEFPLYQIWLD